MKLSNPEGQLLLAGTTITWDQIDGSCSGNQSAFDIVANGLPTKVNCKNPAETFCVLCNEMP